MSEKDVKPVNNDPNNDQNKDNKDSNKMLEEKPTKNLSNKGSNKDLQSQGSKKKKTQIDRKVTQQLDQQEQQPSEIDKCREKTLKLAESSVVEAIMMICTFYALFADDVRILGFTVEADDTFYIITFICLVLFFLEFMTFNFVKPGYPLSFTFWMDLVSSVSLIFDIPWFSKALFGLELEGGGGAEEDLVAAGKVSRVTTRAARLVRFIRLIRLIRVGKLYKHAFDALNEKVENYMEGNNQFEEDDQYNDQPKLDDKLIDAFADKDQGQGDGQEDKGNNKKKKKEEKKNQKQNHLTPAAAQKKHSPPIGPMNKEYDERAKKYAFGKTKSTMFVNPDVIGMDSHSEDSDYGEKRKKNNLNNFIPEEEISQDKETKISRKLSDLTTRRVITLIFSVMISIPFFSKETYLDDETSFQAGLELIFKNSKYAKGNDNTETQAFPYLVDYYISYHKDEANEMVTRYPIIKIHYGDNENFRKGEKFGDYEDLRTSEYTIYHEEIDQDISVSDEAQSNEALLVLVSLKIDTNLNSALSLLRTTFLIVLLSAAAVFFTKDSNELVLNPIERMLNKVKRIGANPLEAARIAEDEAVAEEIQKHKLDTYQYNQKQIEKGFETSILESTIIKIGALLALGFGEAGSEIIAKNMNREGAVNPMIAGRKIMAIFGFVAIREFVKATEILEQRVMIYANEIADIVHQVCDKNHGAANKNLGDCFLMVWKFKEDEFVRLTENDEVAVKNLTVVKNYSDQAVIAFIKTIAFSKKQSISGNLSKLIQDIQKVEPNFKMHLGFGLHMGWGIEGAIGSEFKIDASYLSPNVNLASRLEYATKQYGVPILLSGQIYRLLSHRTQSYLRQVDRVTLKGSKQPMDLYTCDIDPSRLKFNQNQLKKKPLNKKVLRVVARIKKSERYIKIMKNKEQVSTFFEQDLEFIQMRERYTGEFIDTFHEGLDLYLEGFWQEAKKQLEKAQNMLRAQLAKLEEGASDQIVDGPCQTLLKYMSNEEYKAPRTWKGYRSLTDK